MIAHKICTLPQSKLEDTIERLWGKAAVIQRLTYTLMGDLDRSLSELRARKVEGDFVTLTFTRRGIDLSQWLSGEAWSKAAELEEEIRELSIQIETTDPMTEAIKAYRDGVKKFADLPDSREDESANVEATYGPIQTALTDNPPEVTSIEGVRDAIRLAFDEEAFCCRMSEAVLKSALAFLDREVLS